MQLTSDVRDGREVEMDRDRGFRAIGSCPEEDELATRVHRYSHDTLDTNPFPEIVVLPAQPFVERVRDVVRRVFVIREKENRSLVSVLPDVRVLVYFLPREATVAGQERVRVGVGQEVFADVSDCQHETDCRRRRVRRARVSSLSVSVNVKGAAL